MAEEEEENPNAIPPDEGIDNEPETYGPGESPNKIESKGSFNQATPVGVRSDGTDYRKNPSGKNRFEKDSGTSNVPMSTPVPSSTSSPSSNGVGSSGSSASSNGLNFDNTVPSGGPFYGFEPRSPSGGVDMVSESVVSDDADFSNSEDANRIGVIFCVNGEPYGGFVLGQIGKKLEDE